jgi:hypothetical protein
VNLRIAGNMQVRQETSLPRNRDRNGVEHTCIHRHDDAAGG